MLRASVVTMLLAGLVACGGGTSPEEPDERSTAALAGPQSEPGGEPDGSDADLWEKAAALNAADVQQDGTAAPEGATATTGLTTKAVTPVDVYRFFNSRSTAHFYTASASERDRVLATMPSLRYEGLAFQASSTADAALSPVHRFYNTQTGVHFYTISAAERDHLIANLKQFIYEGVAYHASTVAATGFRPLYRFYLASRGVHFFTTSSAEAGQVIAGMPQYRYEGIAYYVLGQADPAPPSGVGYHGNPVPVPPDGAPVDTSQPDRVIGTGTPASCTGQAVVDAVALGGKIRFNCGPNPVTITLPTTDRKSVV